MEFNLKELNPGSWFDLPKGGRVKVRIAPPAVLKQIRNKTTKKSVEFRRGQRYEVITEDGDKSDMLLWDYCIVDWEGVTSDGKKIPCNAKNKALLMGESIEFGNVIAEALETITNSEAEIVEATEKN